MKNQSRGTLEIFSGDLLARRDSWQHMKYQLPTHTYLLVSRLPSRSIKWVRLGRRLREAGASVCIVSLG